MAFRTVEAMQRAHRTVKESPEPVRDTVHPVRRRRERENCPVPGEPILVQILQIIQKLERHTIAETEIRFLILQFSFYQPAVGQYRRSSFCHADSQLLSLIYGSRFLLLAEA